MKLHPALVLLAAGAVLAQDDRSEVRVPVSTSTVTVVESLPACEKGSEVPEFAKAFPTRALETKAGVAAFEVGREPVYVLDGDTSLDAVLPAEGSPFGFHPASVMGPGDRYAYAREIGIRWHRGLYAYWILIQPTQEDIDTGTFHWEQNDAEWGSVPETMAILGNIGLPERRGEGGSWISTWKLNQPEEAYLKFVKAVVERYDGDGEDDMPGLKVPIRHWQVENEPDIASEDWQGYAHIQEITSGAIKEACPEATVLMGGQTGGGIPVFDKFYAPALERLGGRCVDVYDIHYYGDAKMDWRGVSKVYGHVRKELDRLGYSKTRIWITEMGSYSGQPGDEESKPRPAPRNERERNHQRDLDALPKPPRIRLAAQSEREQARDVVKRYVFPLSIGVEKVFWAFGLMEGFQHDDGYFDHTGFVYDGEFDDDPARGTKKLAYVAYRKMTQVLDGADWSRAETLDLGKDVCAIRVPRGQGRVTVVWFDPAYPKTIALSKEALAEVRRRLDGMGTEPTDAGNVRERFRTLRELILYVLQEGGPACVEDWAPREAVVGIEERLRKGDADAPAAVEELLGKAREAFAADPKAGAGHEGK